MNNLKENPKKRLAIELAHQMDYERKMRIEPLREWEKEEVREVGNKLRMDIVKSGYSVEDILFLAEQYKTLSLADYMRWIND